MKWILRIMTSVPGTPERAVLWAMHLGVMGVGLVLMLANLPLGIAAALLPALGLLGLAVSTRKAKGTAAKTALTPLQEAEQDAAVDVFVRHMEAVERFQAMAANEERPPRSRLH